MRQGLHQWPLALPLSQPSQQFSIAHVRLRASGRLLGMQGLTGLVALLHAETHLFAGLPELLDVVLSAHPRVVRYEALTYNEWRGTTNHDFV